MNPCIPKRRAGFSLVEAIFTIAIIGIMASLVISTISNAARDTYRVVARQQQAAVQEALHAWVMSQTRVSGTGGQQTPQVRSLESVRDEYNKLRVTSARFEKLRPDPTNADPNKRAGFLDAATFEHFETYSRGLGTDKIKSAALEGTRQYLSLPDWKEHEEPKVELLDD